MVWAFDTSSVKDKFVYYVCVCVFAERAAKVAEQQERERAAQYQASPRAGTPVAALMGVVPPATPMGMINPSMTPVSGNPSQMQLWVPIPILWGHWGVWRKKLNC